ANSTDCLLFCFSPHCIVIVLFYLILISFVFNGTPSPEVSTLSLHDALPIYGSVFHEDDCEIVVLQTKQGELGVMAGHIPTELTRSEEHTSEVQSRFDLVCRLLLEKKKKQGKNQRIVQDDYEINDKEKSTVNK